MDFIDERYWSMPSSTLGELRRVVGDCEGLPDDSLVRVRTSFAVDSAGSPLRRVGVRSRHRVPDGVDEGGG